MGFSYVDLRGLRAPLLPAGDHLPEVPVTRQAGTGFPFFQDHVSGHILVGSQQVHLIRDIRCSSSRGCSIRKGRIKVNSNDLHFRLVRDLQLRLFLNNDSGIIRRYILRCHHRRNHTHHHEQDRDVKHLLHKRNV